MKSEPRIEYVNNRNWYDHEICGSLICALEQLEGKLAHGFVVAYADLLFEDARDIMKLYESKAPISFLVQRKEKALKNRYPTKDNPNKREPVHPWDREAEIVVTKKGKIEKIGKAPLVFEDEEEYGEFVGVVRFSRRGVSILKSYLYGMEQEYKKSYLTDLIQAIIKGKQSDVLEKKDVEGMCIEIDTLKDLMRARECMKMW